MLHRPYSLFVAQQILGAFNSYSKIFLCSCCSGNLTGDLWWGGLYSTRRGVAFLRWDFLSPSVGNLIPTFWQTDVNQGICVSEDIPVLSLHSREASWNTTLGPPQLHLNCLSQFWDTICWYCLLLFFFFFPNHLGIIYIEDFIHFDTSRVLGIWWYFFVLIPFRSIYHAGSFIPRQIALVSIQFRQ